MKIVAVNTMEGFVPDYYRYEVRLNGGLVKNFIMADEEKGKCIVIVINENGIVMNDLRTGPKVELLEGVVTIRRTSAPITDRFTEEYLKIFSRHHFIGRAQ